MCFGIMYHQGAAGSFAYFGPDEAKLGKQQARLDPSETGPLKQLLQEKFRGREVSFEDMMKETWETPSIESNYREAIRALQTEGVVKITPVSSKTALGLKEKDLVLFRV